MMKRYFYTDALAVAWMLQHHGIHVTRTQCHRGDGTFGESMLPIPIWILARDVENQVSERVKYYIHPDSMKLLGPREGDLLKVWLSSPAVSGPLATDHFILGCPWDEMEFDLEYEDHRIIERKGRAFHWPQLEAA